MKSTLRLIAFHAATLSLMAQSPEPREPKDGPPPPHPPHPLMVALDADRNGEISAEEMENASDALAKVDQDGDGKISREELFAKPPLPRDGEKEPKMKRPPAVIDVLDADKDGRLSAQEMRRADKSLETLDRNQDRELSPDEMFGPPPQGDQGGPQGHQGPPAGGNRPPRPMAPPRGPQGGPRR